MNSQQVEGIPRLRGYRLSLADPSYLVYRGLFSNLEKASDFAKGRLLDIGCGNKPYERMFEGKIEEYVGCDVVQSSENRADIICSASQIPLDASSFDTILCTQVIEHVADPSALLQEANRLLRAGGVLLLSGPMYWPLHEEPFDFFRFTKYGFCSLLEKTGFSVLSINSNGGKWAFCGQVLIHTLQGTRLYKTPFIKAINRIFSTLDDRRTDSVNTINYVVVARKS